MSADEYLPDELDALLRASGSSCGVEEVVALVRAVAAAPTGYDPTAWLELVAPEGASELRARLLEMHARIRAEQPDEPAPAERLARLRAELERVGVDGFLLPLTDEHGSEYLPEASRRLSWLTGFTGSAGFLVVLPESATLFVDGRYTLQAAAQLDPELYERVNVADHPPSRWLGEHLERGRRIGYDPALHQPSEVAKFEKAARRADAELVPLEANPVDLIWSTRPPLPVSPIVRLEETYAGESSEQKRTRIGEEVREAGADLLVVSAPDSIAWLLNVRGGDVPFNPVTLAYLLLHADGAAELFVDRRKLRAGQHLGNRVSIQPIETFEASLEACARRGQRVLADPNLINAKIVSCLKQAGARVVESKDPVVAAKARKNPVEIAGARRAQVRDGAAMVCFLAWLDRAAEGGTIGELEAADRLVAERAKDPLFRGESFPAISGAGPNGAIVHYRVTRESARKLEPGTLYLIDSGGQYLDATTDVTRTVPVGRPSNEMRRHFTLVLKGHIRIARAVFPTGTSGAQIDAFARQALWEAGLDYDHGTGHGVGAYLCVHEGPARISKRAGEVALEPGMILSNEPGYYRAGWYGIRIENLVLVSERPMPEGGERPVLGFETLTRVPIDRRLVRADLLAPDERAWLDNYHARVRADLQAMLEDDARAWLLEATRPL